MAAFQHPVVNLENKQVGTVDLLPEVFKLEDVNQHLIWEAVRHFLAKRRQGTAKTKDRWEVRGSGKKLLKQKGTGRARVGSVRSPLWRHGGTTHGPDPRNHDYAFPKKARRAALRNALSVKFAKGQVLVVENWEVETHKTKALAGTLGRIGVTGSALLVGTEASEKVQLAAANNIKVKTIESLGVNVFDLLKFDQVVFSREAVLALQEVVKP
ncbi:MAG: 50S ribosomal protein L4 [Acidobacteria bacterium]|nr:50S ribosomal protein L4 [Acidobacteriota bacterium]